MNKDLAQNKVNNFFNIGDTKIGKIEGRVEYTTFSALILAKKIKNKLRTKSGLLSHRT